jgi:hypothetical protein
MIAFPSQQAKMRELKALSPKHMRKVASCIDHAWWDHRRAKEVRAPGVGHIPGASAGKILNGVVGENAF